MCQLLDQGAEQLVQAANVRELRGRLDKLPRELPELPDQVGQLRGRVTQLETGATA